LAGAFVGAYVGRFVGVFVGRFVGGFVGEFIAGLVACDVCFSHPTFIYIDAYHVEESQTSANELEEPEPSQDELATSFYTAATSSSHQVEESDYDDLLDIVEEPEISADELELDTPVEPTPSRKHSSKR
jgi:hypothetical protein